MSQQLAEQLPFGDCPLEDTQGSQAYLECQDNRVFMRSLKAERMKLIITSPPYNIGKSYEKSLSFSSYIEQQTRVIADCVKILHPQGSLCWQVGNYVKNGEIVPLDIALYDIFKSHGLKLRNRIVWHFEHGLHCSKRLSGRHETMLWFTKSDDYTFNLDSIRVPSKYPQKKYFKGPRKGLLSCNPLGKNPGDVWIFPNVKHNHVEKTVHPCQYPIELVERCVLSLTNEGDDIFDPYVGVGTSVIAAVKHGRHGWGCDIAPQYIAIARQRLTSLRQGSLGMREMNTPIYRP